MSADFVSKLTELLVTTFTTPDSALRARAEHLLEDAAKDLVGFAQALIQIMQSQPLAIAHGAGAYLCNTVTKAHAEGRLLGTARQSIGLLLGQTVVQASLESSIKTRLAESLATLISSEITDPQTNLASLIQPIVLQALQGDIGSVLGGLKMLRPMYQALMETPDFTQLVYLELLASIAFKAIQGVRAATKEELESQLNDAVAVLNEVSCCLQSIIEYYEVTSLQNMAVVLKFIPVSEAMVQTLLLQLPEPGNPSYSAVVNVSPNYILTMMNYAKANMLDCLIHLSSLVLDFPDQRDYMPSHAEDFWRVIQPSIVPVLTAVLELSNSPSLKEYLNLEFVSDYLTKALDFLATISKEPRLTTIFLPRVKILIVDALMLLMVANQHELEEFEDSPEEFLSLVSDTCERQESQIPKTCAASFLDSLCSNVDGCLSFTVRLCCQFICHISQRDDVNNYVIIAELTDSHFYNLPEEAQVETCLTILSVLSKHMARRYDLHLFVDSMLGATGTTLLATVQPLLLARLCGFVYYNAEYLARDNDALFEQLILVTLRAVQLNHAAASVAGADCLTYLLKEEAVCYRLVPMLGEIVQVILDCVQNTTVKGVFDALEEIALNFVEELASSAADLLTALVRRVLAEQQAILRQHSKESIFIIKSWNIIRILADTPQMVSKLDTFEQIVLPLLSTISDPAAISYDEDLVLLTYILITKRMSVSQVCWEVFTFLPHIQTKNRNVFFQMFELLNAYIYFGKDVLTDSPHYVEQLVQMCEVCLFATYTSRACEAMNAEGAVILQIMLQELPGTMDKLLDRVVETALHRLSSKISNDFLRVRLLGVVLSGFIYNAQLTQQVLAAKQIGTSSCLSYFVTQIVQYRGGFTHVYDRKLAVFGLCTLLSHPMLETDVVQKLSILFETIVDICSRALQRPKPVHDMDLDVGFSRKKRKTKQSKDESEANCKMASLLTQINDIDELEVFKRMLKSIAGSSSAGLKLLVGNMRPDMLKDLELLVKSKTVPTNLLGTTVVRQVIRAKHQV
jgi:hypothetical protein